MTTPLQAKNSAHFSIYVHFRNFGFISEDEFLDKQIRAETVNEEILCDKGKDPVFSRWWWIVQCKGCDKKAYSCCLDPDTKLCRLCSK